MVKSELRMGNLLDFSIFQLFEFDVDELLQPGVFGVRAAVAETDSAGQALKESILQYPYKVDLFQATTDCCLGEGRRGYLYQHNHRRTPRPTQPTRSR